MRSVSNKIRSRSSHHQRSAGCVSEALEPRLLMSVAKAGGGSGFSGTLSRNATLRQQQLICDPFEPLQGQTSVLYDASKVELRSYGPGPGYDNGDFRGFIEVLRNNQRQLFGLVTYFTLDESERPPQTGYVQIYYTLTGQAGQIQPPQDYQVTEEGGVEGMDTHQLMFRYLPGVPDDAAVSYTVMSAPPNMRSGNAGDYLIYASPNGPQRLEWSQLSPAVVSNASALVYTGSSAWTPAFRNYLAARGVGNPLYGYRAYARGDQSSFTAPWTNIDQLTVLFDAPIPAGSVVNAARAHVTNANGQSYTVTAASYDSATRAARLQLSGALPAGDYKVSLDLDAYPGADREALVSIQPGDTDSSGAVNASDLVRARNRVGRTINSAPGGASPYDPFTDVDGNGAINATDLVLVRNRVGATARLFAPTPPRSIFAERPVGDGIHREEDGLV